MKRLDASISFLTHGMACHGLPWVRKHDGPYRVMYTHGPNITVFKVYFPQDGPIQVRQTRVTPCPSEFLAGLVAKEVDLDAHPNGQINW